MEEGKEGKARREGRRLKIYMKYSRAERRSRPRGTPRGTGAVSYLSTGWLQRCLGYKINKGFTEEIQPRHLLINEDKANSACYFCTLGNL